MRTKRTSTWLQALLAALLMVAVPVAFMPSARAKPTAKKTKPSADPDDDDDVEMDPDRELFIRNIVQSATKSVTTVQEAPTIINIITAEDIENYGFRDMIQAMMSLPSHLFTNSQNSLLPYYSVRGVSQAMLYLKDGLSLFDPAFNVVPSMHTIPLENIKRIEVMSNPGGVLWGANSFLGIANVITKDAEDINGLEMAIGFSGIPGGGFKEAPAIPVRRRGTARRVTPRPSGPG